MNFALLRCCTTPIALRQYELSTNAVLDRLRIGLVDVEDFNCCGYPLRNFNLEAYLLASARNLALAEKRSLDILTVCNCCFGSLKHAEHAMKEDASLRRTVNRTLEKEGLKYEGDIGIKHLLHVLYHDVGMDKIKENVVRTFSGLKIATHYGCHLLRPRKIVQFDNPFSPAIFDRLVQVTGAESISWPQKTECCGSPVWGVNNELSMDLTAKKLDDAIQSGAHYLCVACPYCQIQFDKVQSILLSCRSQQQALPSVLYPQLLGLSLGIDGETLGLKMNDLPIHYIERFLSAETQFECH